MFITKDSLIGNNPTSEQISVSFQLASSTTINKLQFFHLANAHVIEHVTDFLFQNSKLKELVLRNSKLQTENTIKNSNIRNLRIFNISSNDIAENVAESIACFLSQNCKLEELHLGHNKLQAAGGIKIAEMSNITNLKKFDIFSNNITEDAAESIVYFLSQNCILEELDLSFNKLQAAGAIKIAEICNITNLRKLNISSNGITEDAAESIAHFFSQNCKLTWLDLSHNKLQTAGAIKIIELSNTKNLIYFDISYNNITDQAARDKVNICFKRLYPTGVKLVL